MNHRLHSLCPYFAMFPPTFVRSILRAYTKVGDLVFDPFSGRGTTLLESLLNGREAIACDINPVAYCVSAAKAKAPSLSHLLFEIEALESSYWRSSALTPEIHRRKLTPFFRRAFHAETLRQLLFLRRKLKWRHNPTHTFIAALVLGHLHGEMDRSPNYCSNQMPHSISSKPSYSLNYWRENELRPPERDVFDLLWDRAEYRLSDEPPPQIGRVVQADVRKAAQELRKYVGKVAAVVTSPPYLDITSFEEDQWLRLWFLGGPPHPTYGQVSLDDRHTKREDYWKFLYEAWAGIQPLLKPGAILTIRIGGKDLDKVDIVRHATETLRSVWSRIMMIDKPVSTLIPKSQAKTLSPDSVGCRFEIDLTYMIPRPLVSFAGSRLC